ncbi:PHD finger-containing protein 1-like isoform X2 [Cornus florida]|nr:PHD finger-containing protein 1-like isoform X2 [Cornus florida]
MTVCQTCGDEGEIKLLIYCVKCQDSAVHHYCLDNFSPDDDCITWMCVECAPKEAAELLSSRKSEPVNLRKDQAVEVRMNRKKKLNKNCSLKAKRAVYMDRPAEIAQLPSNSSLPCEEMKNLHSIHETRGNQELIKHRRRLILEDGDRPEDEFELIKAAASPLPPYDHYGPVNVSYGQRSLKSDMDRPAETAQLPSESSLPCEEMKNLYSIHETRGNQELRKHRRRLILEDGDSQEDEFELIKAAASPLPPYDHYGSLNVSYGQRSLKSDMDIPAETTQLPSDSSLPCEEMKNLHSIHETRKNQELRKHRRRLILEDGYSPEDECELIKAAASPLPPYDHYGPVNVSYGQRSLKSDNYVHARPIVDPIWRGSFRIGNKKDKILVGIMAHLSSKACSKVSDAASLLPPKVDVEILPRCDAWPKSFKRLPPTNDSIALYFFPEYERDEKVFDRLLDEIIEHNLSLKAEINDVDLLVFSSLELPQQNWRFCRKYYMWGVFKPKQYSCALVQPTILEK